MSDLRAVIREMLKQELAGLKNAAGAAEVRQEFVTINTDEELASFVSRLIKISADANVRSQLLQGQFIFKLAPDKGSIDKGSIDKGSIDKGPAKNDSTHSRATPAQQSLVTNSQAIDIESGLVTEKDVKKMPIGLNHIRVGETVRFTPLASDEIRRRRIKIQRRTS